MSCRERVLIGGITVVMLAGNIARAQDEAFAPGQAQVEVNVSGRTVSTKAPLTVQVRPTAELSAAFDRAGDSETSIRLCVQALAPKPGEWTGFHVFLNTPRVRSTKTIESPHLVGSVAFYGEEEGETVTFALDLGQTIQHLKQERLWRPNKPLMVTVVAVPGNILPKRETLGIVIKQIVVSVHATSGS